MTVVVKPRSRLAAIGLMLAAGILSRCPAIAEEPLTADFTPPTGRGCPAEVHGGPCGKRLLGARSADGLRFTRTNRIVTDQGDVPDVVVDHRGWIYLYYVGATVGTELNKLVVAISRDQGETWIYKKAVLSGFEGMSDPVDPDAQILPDGTFRLYLTTGQRGEHVRTWYAEGIDGIRFERKGMAFDPPGEPLDPSTIEINGTWQIFAGGATREPGANWHGTSHDGAWFVFDGEKLFVKEGRPHAVSNIIAVEGGYRLYAFTHGAERIINSFFSADGLDWTPEPGARLEMDPATGLESAGVKDAAVARLADGSYFMVYVTEIQEPPGRAVTWDLNFVPDPGVRVDNASLPKPCVDESGAVYLYYENHGAQPPREMVSVSADGLDFPPGSPPRDRACYVLRQRLPDGSWRLYQWDPRAAEMRSASSVDGLQFTPDPGVRYRPVPEDRGSIGVYDHFTDSKGGVVLLYIGDMFGLNNIRRAYSPPGDNGWNFHFERGDVLGDADAGGGPNSYVDQKHIRLPDGRIRLFVMKRGVLYSFVSEDEGRSFHLEPGVRLAPGDFGELRVKSLHDPIVVRLPDGRYRMYVAAALDEPRKFVVVSATTPPPVGPVTGAYLMSFHACDTAAANCRDPRNHRVYLAQSDDGAAWRLTPGWPSFPGSVPDVIRRGETVYVYGGGSVVRQRLDESRIEPPAQVRVDGLEGGFVDPSLILDEQGRLVLFFLYGRLGSDPAGCPPGQASCVNRFGSATEIPGSDGTHFRLDEGDRLSVSLGEGSPWRSASDPDVFFDGERFVMYVSHGQSVSVWASSELRGAYLRMADLSSGGGGVPAGHFDPATRQYWTYAHASRGGPGDAAVIRRAVHSGFARLLTEQDWVPVLTAPDLGWPATTNIESPGFAVNRPEGR